MQPIRNVSRGLRVCRHCNRRRPHEIFVEYSREQRIGDSDVVHRSIETFDRPTVHLLVRSVATVNPDHRRFIPVPLAVGRRTSPRLAPVGREPLGVLGVESVAECVRHYLVRQDPLVPRLRQPPSRRAERRFLDTLPKIPHTAEPSNVLPDLRLFAQTTPDKRVRRRAPPVRSLARTL